MTHYITVPWREQFVKTNKGLLTQSEIEVILGQRQSLQDNFFFKQVEHDSDMEANLKESIENKYKGQIPLPYIFLKGVSHHIEVTRYLPDV